MNTLTSSLEVLPNDINLNTEISGILSNTNVYPMVSIYTQDDISIKDKQVEQLLLQLKKRNWKMWISIYYIHSGYLSDINRENQYDFQKNKNIVYLKGEIIVGDDFENNKVDWR